LQYSKLWPRSSGPVAVAQKLNRQPFLVARVFKRHELLIVPVGADVQFFASGTFKAREQTVQMQHKKSFTFCKVFHFLECFGSRGIQCTGADVKACSIFKW